MADWSPSIDPHQDSNQDCLGFGKSEGLFYIVNCAIDWPKILKNSRYVPLDLRSMAGETMCSFWELQSTQTFSWQSSWWWKLLQISFSATQWIICRWISRGEGIHVRWDEGQIMKVIDLKKQAKNSRFYSLVLFTTPHEKPWERKLHPIALSPNIFSLEDETKSLSILICNEKKNQIF